MEDPKYDEVYCGKHHREAEEACDKELGVHNGIFRTYQYNIESTWEDLRTDIFRYQTLNCFRTEQEAEAYRDYLLAVGKVTRRINELNDGWEPDFEDDCQGKYYLFHFDNKEWTNEAAFETQLPMSIPHIRSSFLAKQIISELTPELETIRNYSK